MAELALAAFASLGSAATAAAGAVTGAAAGLGGAVAGAAGLGGAGAAAGGLGGTLSLLSGVATAGSVLMSLAAGTAEAAEASMMAKISQVNAAGEALASEERALRIKQDALRRIGSARVAFAASGIAGGDDPIVNSINDQANFETSIERNNAKLAGIEASMNQSMLKRRAQTSIASSRIRAVTAAANGAIDIANRG